MSPSDFGTSPTPSRRTLVLCAAGLALATLAAYSNALTGPFLLDDIGSIPNNTSIRGLWPLMAVLSPPATTTVHGRPVLNLSFALNYAVSGTGTWSYHALNILIHILAGLILFGLVRRTLLQPVLRPKYGPIALPVAWVSTLLWLLHPVQAQCVAYIVQRAESLMGLFYLLTLYCFVRGCEKTGQAGRRWWWFLLSCLACLFAMETKEVAVTAPLMVLLYDRTFISGSFREAWRRHGWIFGALAATWIAFLPLIAAGGRRDVTSGFGVGVPFPAYAATQFHAVAHYLAATFWPSHLLLYYEPRGWVDYARLHPLPPVAPYALLIAPLIALSAFALWRRPVAGFAGAWFFGILAPTSLVPGASDTVADRRLYLSLAAILVPLVAIGISRGGRWARPLFLAAAAALGVATARHNRVYRSATALWRDQISAHADDALAYYNLGNVLEREGHSDAAAPEIEAALKIDPGYIDAINGLGIVRAQQGRYAEAIAAYRDALRRDPRYFMAEANLGDALRALGRRDEALAHDERAVQLRPDVPEVQTNLALALEAAGRRREAIPHFQAALRLRPDDVETLNHLAIDLAATGRLPEATPLLLEWARRKPGDAGAQYAAGSALRIASRFADAIPYLATAAQLRPDSARAQNDLGLALTGAGRAAEAIGPLQAALRIDPALPGAEKNLGTALLKTQQLSEAIEHYRTALRLNSGDLDARYNLAAALTMDGRYTEALPEFARLVVLLPADPGLRTNYGVALRALGRARDADLQFKEAARLKAAGPQ